jgi:hypothetical protein
MLEVRLNNDSGCILRGTINIIFYMKTIRLGFVPSAKPAATPATPKL